MQEPLAPPAPEPGLQDEAAALKRLRKLEKSLDTRVLGPWERYRALMDVVENYTDILDGADRKTRFALLIMGLLNAVNFLLVARSDVLGASGAPRGYWLGVYAALYAFVSLFFFSQAIEALRPRSARFFRDPLGQPGADQRRLRAMAHVASQEPERYYAFWEEAQVGQLCREVAFTAQSLARMNMEKHAALERVYRGLIGLTALTALLVTFLAYRGLAG